MATKAAYQKTSKSFKERYVIDKQGNPVSVLLSIKDYRRLLEELEELESIRAYDAAKASADEIIPFKQAVAEIEKKRR
ncbi:MAG: type II toxin-antitoxin system Phd/YefM family antitoxin [Thermoproteota archaeon]